MSQRFIINPGIRADLARDLNLGVADNRIFEIDPNFRITRPIQTIIVDPIRPDPRPIDPGTGPAPSDGPAASGGTVVTISVRVQPGDLITADLINFILARLDLLESRPVPTPTVPTITRPTIPTLTFPTFTPTLTFVPTFTVPTLTATFIPPTFGPTIDPTRFTIGPTLFATVNPNLGRAAVPEDPVRVLPGIGTAEEGLLRNAGIIDIRSVADADPVRIADTLRLQPQEAANVVGLARGMLGRIR